MHRHDIYSGRKLLFWGLLLFLFLIFSGNVYGASSAPALLFFSDNVQGETEPCG